MKAKFLGAFVTVLALLAASPVFSPSPVYSHHGFGVEFDGDKCQDLKGTLTGVEWENPHAYVQLSVTTAGKTVAWRLEMITPNALKRNGTTRQDFTNNVGKPMNARYCPARVGGDSRGAAEYIKLADGILRIVGQIPERNMTPDKLSF